jgi:benzodiazapine receptor
MQTRFKNIASLVSFLGLCLSVSAIGGAVTRTSVYDWYQELAKPYFTPPDWVFAPVWIALYLLMGLSAWLIWRRTGFTGGRTPFTIFAVQLALNLAWSFLFFGEKLIGWAAIELGFLWTAIALNIWVFWRIDRLASGLLFPYFLWTSFAGVLNISIYILN